MLTMKQIRLLRPELRAKYLKSLDAWKQAEKDFRKDLKARKGK